MFNLTIDLQSLKILFLSHTLSRSSLLQFIRKLVTRRICLPNSKLCTQTSKKLCYQTREGFTKVENSTWLQTTNHLKYHSYHIHYSNMACLSSLKNQLQSVFTYQIPSSAPKLIRSYATKMEKCFTKVESSTWLQTISHLKYHSYHIRYSNLVFLGSLES